MNYALPLCQLCCRLLHSVRLTETSLTQKWGMLLSLTVISDSYSLPVVCGMKGNLVNEPMRPELQDHDWLCPSSTHNYCKEGNSDGRVLAQRPAKDLRLRPNGGEGIHDWLVMSTQDFHLSAISGIPFRNLSTCNTALHIIERIRSGHFIHCVSEIICVSLDFLRRPRLMLS